MSAHTGGYYLPEPSYWPIVGSLALMCGALGGTLMIHGMAGGGWLLTAGAAALATMLVGWFGRVIHESESGLHDAQVDLSFRWGMGWFIFSEVMFFAAFLRRPVLRQGDFRAGSGRRRAAAPALAGLYRRLAHSGAGAQGQLRRPWRPGASRRSTPCCC
jgi:hypothetical protein